MIANHNGDESGTSRIKVLQQTNNVRELQTIIRDK